MYAVWQTWLQANTFFFCLVSIRNDTYRLIIEFLRDIARMTDTNPCTESLYIFDVCDYNDYKTSIYSDSLNIPM